MNTITDSENCVSVNRLSVYIQRDIYIEIELRVGDDRYKQKKFNAKLPVKNTPNNNNIYNIDALNEQKQRNENKSKQ